MKLQVHWNGLIATPTLREHLERRLTVALGRFGEEVGHVWARLADLNGPKGGIDKLVSLRVRGRRLKTLMVTDSDSNLCAAIDRASDRIGRAIARALDKSHGHNRQHQQLLPERARTPRRR
ncbi:MAG: HPF/RaiA family ribosome-associated protein [Planctomycetes bacterium]|nr:HPF/RaiA family ribosome-associated protein [Planctomycetota bacterium]